RVIVERGAARGVRYRTADGAEHTIDADAVVVSADLHHAERDLLGAPHRDHSDRWWRRRDAGPGAVLAMLGVRGRLPQLARPSLYIGKPSQTDADVAPPDHENLFVLVPVPAQPALGRGGIDGAGDPGVEAFVDRAIAQIATWADIPDLAERIVVRRTVAPGD